MADAPDDEGKTSDPSDAANANQNDVAKWVQEIDFYEQKSQKFEMRGRKIIRRYRDERSPREVKMPRYNILWSNIQTLKPALYSRTPKPDIERRFRDKDDLGRISSMVLERSVSFFVGEKFDEMMDAVVLDRLLPGRGTAWVRYEPHFRDAEEPEKQDETEDLGVEVTEDSDEEAASDETPQQEVYAEDVAFDYVHFEDFGHNFGRVWDEVTRAWRKVHMTRKELVKRFGEEIGNKVNLDWEPTNIKDQKTDSKIKKATVYECWDKEEKRVYWIHKDYQDGFLDEQDDPLELCDFWPFPKPLFATLANDELFPTADYIEYQDQAHELDELTSRIGAITKAVKVAGVYDASAEGVQRILVEGTENQLIPVERWAALSEKGGLAGVMTLMPMDAILKTLLGLYEARDKVKSDLYEITGLADIMRGASDPNETATAQSIKSNFGTMRLTDMQDDVQRFARDLIRIAVQIIAKHFSLDTLKKISGMQLLMDAEKPLMQAYLAMMPKPQPQGQQSPMMGHNGGPPMGGQTQPPQGMMQPPGVAPPQGVGQPNPQGAPPMNQPGMPPPPQLPASVMPPAPPMPLPQLPPEFKGLDQEDLQELLDNPSWEEVEALLKDEPALSYKVDIETNSTIKGDQEAEKASRVEFLKAAGGFLQSAMQVQSPDLQPLMAKLLMFGVRGFPVGKELESAFEIAIGRLEKDVGNQKPNPEMMKAQAEQQMAKARLQGDMQIQQAKLQADSQLEQMRMKGEQQKMQLEDQRAQLQAQADQHQAVLDQQMEQWKAKLDSETKIAVAQIAAKASLQKASMAASSPETGAESVDAQGNVVKQPSMGDLMTTVVQQLQQALAGNSQQIAQSHAMLAQAMSKPKQVMRDDQGNITGVQ